MPLHQAALAPDSGTHYSSPLLKKSELTNQS
jgi:hypothetical protein